MIKRLNTRERCIAEKIVDLQRKSYIIEAKLINFYDIPTLKDTAESIIECDEIFYGFIEGDELAGIISYKFEDGIIDIHRVAVDPSFFRKGIAKTLIKFIEESTVAERIVVATGAKNHPAVKLYLSMGFKKIEERQIVGELVMAFFEKEIK